MESFNATLLRVLNGSSDDSTLEQSCLKRSIDLNNLPTDSAIIKTFPTALIYVLALGIPGNVLVLAVYAFNMTTSTRVHMFALAVADSAVCICGLIMTTVPHDTISLVLIQYLTVMAVAFSGLLLSFVAIERMLAVRHPHTFSLSSLRAKRALWVIAIVSGICSLAFSVARIYNKLAAMEIVAAVGLLIASNVTVIISCYTVLALTMMMQARDAKRNVGVTSNAPAVSNGVSTISTKAGVSCTSGTLTTTTKQVTVYKNVAVLFIITIVFLLSWMPVLFVGIGIFPRYEILIRIYLFNSLINPFIYSAVSRMFRKYVLLFYRQTRARLTTFRN